MCPPAKAAFIGIVISNAAANLAVVFIMLISILFRVKNVNTSDLFMKTLSLYIFLVKILPFNWMKIYLLRYISVEQDEGY